MRKAERGKLWDKSQTAVLRKWDLFCGDSDLAEHQSGVEVLFPLELPHVRPPVTHRPSAGPHAITSPAAEAAPRPTTPGLLYTEGE